MEIVKIDVFQVDYKLLDQEYSWSRGQSVSSFVSTIIRITTDTGLKGYGEVCPLGSAFMDAYAKGVPAGVKEIGRHILGQDPCQLNLINHLMDVALLGHYYVKSPVDIACWDIFGQATSTPVCTLLGGRVMDKFPLYRAISQGPPEQMRARAPKPLAPVAGKPLLEYTVASLKQADVKDLIIVTGYHAYAIREYFGDGTEFGVRISYVHNPLFQNGNGTSLKAADSLLSLGEPFLLLMSDHCIDAGIVSEAMRNLRRKPLLCVDQSPYYLSQVEDATKVFVDSERRIRKIGKQIPR